MLERFGDGVDVPCYLLRWRTLLTQTRSSEISMSPCRSASSAERLDTMSRSIAKQRGLIHHLKYHCRSVVLICACSDKGSTYLRDTPGFPRAPKTDTLSCPFDRTSSRASPPPSYDAAPETRTGGAHSVVLARPRQKPWNAASTVTTRAGRRG